jgi:hypothetical protein
MTTVAQVAASTSPVRNKIDNVVLFTTQALTTAPRVLMSSELDTTNILSVSIFIHLGRKTETSFTAGVNFRVEASATSSGDGYWFPITQFTSALGTSVGSEAVNGACLANQKVIPMAATAGFTVGGIIYISNLVEGNDEWARVTVVTTDTSITIEDNLRFVQTGSTVYAQAEMYYALVDTSTIKRLRVVIDGSGAAQNFDAEIIATVGA